MKQAVFKGANRFELCEVRRPTPKPGEVVVRVEACSICGSDVHLYQWDMAQKGDETPSIVKWGRKVYGYPVHFIMGHQFCGRIEELDAGVTKQQVGDRVVCRGAGAYAEYARAGAVYPMPATMSFEQGAFVEPLSVVVDAIRRSHLKLGDTVVIQGAGTIGLLTLQAARASGAGRVYVTERKPLRLAKARALGADAAIDASTTDVVAAVDDLTAHEGPDIVFDCTGSPEANQRMLEMLPIGGTAVILSSYKQTCELDLNIVMLKSLNLLGMLSGAPCSYDVHSDPFAVAMDLLDAGRVNVDALISATIPLDQINHAFQALARGEEMAVVIKP